MLCYICCPPVLDHEPVEHQHEMLFIFLGWEDDEEEDEA